jgi:hypothetical protein
MILSGSTQPLNHAGQSAPFAPDLKMSRNTVKSYFNQESLSPRKSSKSTNIEVFTDLIVARLNENGYKLIDIFREIKEL